MRPYIISTDSTADLPKEFYKEHQVSVHPLYYVIDDVTYGGGTVELEPKEFYDLMRNGTIPTTTASNPDYILENMRKHLEEGYDILHISFSSALSCSHNNACVCADQLRDEYPEARIEVIDSLAATVGQGLLVALAVDLKEKGKSMDEVASWVTENRYHSIHEFTVDDLFHLHRGGRVSKSTAIVGSIINIKPILHVDDKGELKPLDKIRGRKKVLTTLVNNMEAKIKDYPSDRVYISHADCIEDANTLATMVREKYGIQQIEICNMCPTIGAHTGPGALALCYMGSKR